MMCKDCYNNEYNDGQIEKKLVPADENRGRPPKHPRKEKVNNKFNIHNAGKISKTHYHYAVGDALELSDALKKQRREKIKRLIRKKNDWRMFKEMLYPEKRFELPMFGNQRKLRYVHISKKDEANNMRGYTINGIKNKIKVINRNIERNEKSLRKHSPIKFKGTRVKLTNSVSFDKQNNTVKLTLWKRKKYKISGTNVTNAHGKKYFSSVFDKIINEKPKYCYLIRKNVGNLKVDNKKLQIYDYYLQYTVDASIAISDDFETVMGIDRGINKIASLVIISKENPSKPLSVKFFRGDKINALKIRSRKQKYFLKFKHNKNKKIKRIRKIEPIVDQELHKISKEIVDIAKHNKCLICLEKLEKIEKSRHRQSKRERYYLSLFTTGKLFQFIQYKANREGIKVITVPPEGTSYLCSHCGSNNTERPYKKPNSKKPSFSLFKCKKCGIELNSDYNAALNIAKKGLNILK